MFEALHKRVQRRWWRPCSTASRRWRSRCTTCAARRLRPSGARVVCPEGAGGGGGGAAQRLPQLPARAPRDAHSERPCDGAPEEARGSDQARQAAGSPRARARAADRPPPHGDGGLWRKRYSAARADPDPGGGGTVRPVALPPPQGAPLARAPRAPAAARPLAAGRARAARRAARPAPPAVLHGPPSARPHPRRVRADRLRAARRGGGEPPGRARRRRAPRSDGALPQRGGAARATRGRR